MSPSEAAPDEFEVALRTWTAHDRNIAEAYAITDLLDLDPALVERMQTAARGDDAGVAMREAAIAKAEQFSSDRIVPMYEEFYQEVLA